jgi:hypothetical protein
MIRKINGCIIDCPFYYRKATGFFSEKECKLGAKLLSTVLLNSPPKDCPLRKEACIYMLSDEVKRKENNIEKHSKT